MSQPNVDTVKRIYEFAGESWRRRSAGEDDPVEQIMELWDPEVVIEEMPEFPDSGTFRGYDGLVRWWTAWFDVYDEIRMEAQEYISADDRVVVPVHHWLRSKAGVPLEYHGTHVWTLRNGRAVHVTGYRELSEALAAIGAEPSGTPTSDAADS
jgi:ketosteroid isomerase-like protein